MLTGVELSTGTIKWETPLGFFTLAGRHAGSAAVGIVWPWRRHRHCERTRIYREHARWHLRAFEVSTGKRLWERALPMPALATPMTYQSAAGRQYVVISASGHPGLGTPTGDYVIAFSLR